MQVNISGQHMDIGQSLRDHIEASLTKHVKKYFEMAIHANVSMSKDRHHLFSTDIFVNEGTGNGVTIKASAQDSDPHRSFDLAVAKVERQLQRYKGRIKKHQKDKDLIREFASATNYTISPFGDKAPEEDTAPAIVAEMKTSIDTLTVGDAVMKMDLMEVPALMFINGGNGRVNMVYYRTDGNIAWVDTPETMTLSKIKTA